MTSPTTAATGDSPRHAMHFGEFVVLMAALMSVNAFGIDIMLPALGRIGHDLAVSVENHQQFVITAYFGGFCVGQLFWGPLADRFGRRRILLGAMVVYAAMSFLAAISGDFELLLGARLLQGLSAASTRVLSVSIIRDCYAGRQMAKVMSLAFMVFLAVPIIAPNLGSLILLVAPWRWIFGILGAYSLGVALWAWLRLPETLDPANILPIRLTTIGSAAWAVVTNRYAIGYTVGMGCLYGGLVGFLTSMPQIVAHSFHAPALFPIAFSIAAAFMVAASLLNARIVERYGMRLISHVAVSALILISLLRLGLALAGHETLATFTLFNGLTLFCYGLAGANFGALAMEPVGHIAGTAASIQGCLTSAIGIVLGSIMGQSFDGTTIPLTLGWELGALASLTILFVAERGRLFRPRLATAGMQAP